MKKIKNIIFDLGGVFIELDYLKTEKAFINLGVTYFPEFYSQHLATPLFADLETGRITKKEFYNGFRKTSGVSLTNQQIKNAWNAMLLKFPHERLQWLKDISKKYKTYLFSNTNVIHYNAVQKIFYENIGQKNFDNFFIKAYYSHTLQMRKPDPAAFEEILIRENLAAAKTLFIDDTPKNIEGAKQQGSTPSFLSRLKVFLILNYNFCSSLYLLKINVIPFCRSCCLLVCMAIIISRSVCSKILFVLVHVVHLRSYLACCS